MTVPTFAGLEGLLDLGQREGVDIRTTLFRVLTDQYAQRLTHTPEEESHYTTLALRLIEETDEHTRAAVASRLATHPTAPRAIIHRLARDNVAVAEPILRHSPLLTSAELAAIARECGPAHAEIIAARRQVQAARPESVARASGASDAEPDCEPAELTELFFAADAAERRLILLNLEYLTWAPPTLPAGSPRTDAWRLETAALQRRAGIIVQELHRVLGVSYSFAERIVEDDLGESFVVAAKAMLLPGDVLQRVLLFLNPKVGRSVDRVYELAALYSEITVAQARRMVAIWRHAEPAGQPQLRTQASEWRNAAENARRALSEIAPRTGSPREAPPLDRTRKSTSART